MYFGLLLTYSRICHVKYEDILLFLLAAYDLKLGVEHPEVVY